jgi:hypothetical protein
MVIKRLAAAALVLLAVAPTAFAEGIDAEGFAAVSPKLNDEFVLGEPPVFAVETALPVLIVIGHGAHVDGDRMLRPSAAIASGMAVPVAERPGTLEWRLPPGSLPTQRPGRYMWQAIQSVGGELEPATALRAFHVTVPSSWQVRGPIPRAMGPRRLGGSMQVSVKTPPGLTAAAFRGMAATSARRWGLTVTGATTRIAGAVDGKNVVGFGGDVPANALGVQRDVLQRRVRTTRRCSGGRCTLRQDVVSSRVVDRDIVVRTGLNWWIGPGPPPLDRYDLESVLIHELGHFAGNEKHLPHCANSPLADGAAPGEWWHTPRDRFAFCDARPVARAASLGSGPRLRFVHRTVVVDRQVR